MTENFKKLVQWATSCEVIWGEYVIIDQKGHDS